jgi:hypothetical protein
VDTSPSAFNLENRLRSSIVMQNGALSARMKASSTACSDLVKQAGTAYLIPSRVGAGGCSVFHSPQPSLVRQRSAISFRAVLAENAPGF